MKLYTKRGDDGHTDLIGGARVSKNHLRVSAYGAVDELNATIGLALADCAIDAINKGLITTQCRLFDLGADLATPNSAKAVSSRLTAEHVSELESQIDAASEQLEPLRSFILPGGSVLAARLHIARTVCRRAEREVVALAEHEAVDPTATIYLNRLADLLFALARLANAKAGVPDVPWLPDQEA
ncbi:MAG: cob(I)yrinic acid a,c-diamide adenosyltransferase [Phycisphaeraceae bacterium]|nr:cob(I)yrinic acid a,c-diamide adenosyltransferase [Phycisphaeraceae bacterium]